MSLRIVTRSLPCLALIGTLAPAWTGCGTDTAAIAPAGGVPGAVESMWPPQLGEPYPDLTLTDPDGRAVALSSFKGRVILLEPIGMSCAACQAFAGANRARPGPFGGMRPQEGLQSIEEYVEQYAGGVRLDDPRLVYVQLLLYGPSARRAPTLGEARRWADHFGAPGSPRPVVLVGHEHLVGRASYDMIPGFQLVDRDFVLRADSTGHRPHDDLWKELLPELGRLVSAVEAQPAVARRTSHPGTVGGTMTDFTLNDAAGRPRSLAELRGDRPALLYFYSGCCGHCSEELPKVLAPAHALERRGGVVVGVQYFGDSTACQRKRLEFELPGTVLADTNGEVCSGFGVGDFTVFALDADGVIRYRGPIGDLPAS